MADRYIDFNSSTGTLTGTWTFTNGSASVTAAGDGDAVNELANGDYIRQSDGIQWYKVTARPDADTITITPIFQQATHTDDVGASLYNSEDGSAVNSDFCHHNQAMTDEVRVAGDIIRVRGGLTYTYAGVDIVADEDGTVNNYIELRGDTAAGDDSWGDGDTTRPVLDFGATAFRALFQAVDYWKVESHDITASDIGPGALYAFVVRGLLVFDCRFYNNMISADGSGFYANACSGVIIQNCEFWRNKLISLGLFRCGTRIEACIFNGGGDSGSYQNSNTGLLGQDSFIYIKDSTFGVTTAHDTFDIDSQNGAIYGRNVILDSVSPARARYPDSFLRIEDYGQIHKAYHGFEFMGDISKDTGESPPSGADYAMFGEPNTNCGSEQALNCAGDWFWGFPIYLDGTEQTITVKIKALDADWSAGGGAGGRPDNSELFIELDYHNGATTRTTAVSSEACTDDTYTGHIVTITPDAAGPAYLKVKLLLYEAGGKIYVDPGVLIDGLGDVSQVIISAHGMDAAFEYVPSGRPRARRHGI